MKSTAPVGQAYPDPYKSKKEKLSAQKNEDKKILLQTKGFEFECYTRDRLVAQDERNLKKFLAEQMRDQEMNRIYSGCEETGNKPERPGVEEAKLSKQTEHDHKNK